MRTILPKPITHPTKVDNYISLLGAASEREEVVKQGMRVRMLSSFISLLCLIQWELSQVPSNACGGLYLDSANQLK